MDGGLFHYAISSLFDIMLHSLIQVYKRKKKKLNYKIKEKAEIEERQIK